MTVFWNCNRTINDCCSLDKFLEFRALGLMHRPTHTRLHIHALVCACVCAFMCVHILIQTSPKPRHQWTVTKLKISRWVPMTLDVHIQNMLQERIERPLEGTKGGERKNCKSLGRIELSLMPIVWVNRGTYVQLCMSVLNIYSFTYMYIV